MHHDLRNARTHLARARLAEPRPLAIDLAVAAGLVSLVGGLVAYGAEVSGPLTASTAIDTSWSALPGYTFYSLCRGVAAYGVSLAFTLIWGTLMARSARAEKLMLPVLDVLQSIPVLGFLPGLVIGLVALFPTRELGLELACVFMIFTGQAWNMTFSYYASVRTVPRPLREAAAVFRISGWRAFRVVELPAAMIGLVWNSMMSMAGGWFFLTVTEAFRLGDKDFRLPGVGSYMAEAIHQGDGAAMVGGVVAMVVMIVGVDQLVWRPIVVWSQRFELAETTGSAPRSWFLALLRRSRLVALFGAWRRALRGRTRVVRRLRPRPGPGRRVGRALGLVVLAVAVVAVGWGALALARLLSALPLAPVDGLPGWTTVLLAAGATLLRTSAAVVLGALWAVPVGVAIGRSPTWSRRLQPVIQVIASFPAPMVFPLVIGVADALGLPFSIGCVLLMVLGAQWYILFNVLAGATAIPTDLEDAARLGGLSRRRIWTTLYLPAVFPHAVTGLVTAAGGAWNASIVSEYLFVHGEPRAAFGLGALISGATARADYPLLGASVLVMALSVVLLNRYVWRRLFRLAAARYTLEV